MLNGIDSFRYQVQKMPIDTDCVHQVDNVRIEISFFFYLFISLHHFIPFESFPFTNSAYSTTATKTQFLYAINLRQKKRIDSQESNLNRNIYINNKMKKMKNEKYYYI